jgi:pantothenate kinase type III
VKLIAVDVGNTSTAVGLWSGGRVSRVSHVDGDTGLAPRAQDRLAASAVAPRAQDRAAAFAAAEALRALGADGIAYVSVVPRADAEWQRFAKRQGVPFVRVNHELFGAASDLSLDYPHPETIGADRLADAAAAVDRYGAPVIV